MMRAVRMSRAVLVCRSLVAVSVGIAVGMSAACGGGSEQAAQAPPRAAETAGGGAAAKPYPLDVCLVSNDKIGGMGDPVVEVYKGQQFEFCCKDCVKDFKADPEKYVAMLAAASKGGSAGDAGHEGHGEGSH